MLKILLRIQRTWCHASAHHGCSAVTLFVQTEGWFWLIYSTGNATIAAKAEPQSLEQKICTMFAAVLSPLSAAPLSSFACFRFVISVCAHTWRGAPARAGRTTGPRGNDWRCSFTRLLIGHEHYTWKSRRALTILIYFHVSQWSVLI